MVGQGRKVLQLPAGGVDVRRRPHHGDFEVHMDVDKNLQMIHRAPDGRPRLDRASSRVR
jgi:hypothetical protein